MTHQSFQLLPSHERLSLSLLTRLFFPPRFFHRCLLINLRQSRTFISSFKALCMFCPPVNEAIDLGLIRIKIRGKYQLLRRWCEQNNWLWKEVTHSALCLAWVNGQRSTVTDVKHRVNCIHMFPGNKSLLCEKGGSAEAMPQEELPTELTQSRAVSHRREGSRRIPAWSEFQLICCIFSIPQQLIVPEFSPSLWIKGKTQSYHYSGKSLWANS